jgi:hypothetical protein
MVAPKQALLLAKMDPPAEHESEWNEYYNNRHVADRLVLPGFLSGRRFTKVEGIPKDTSIAGDAQYLALYDLANTGVLKAEPYQRLREKEAGLSPDSFEVTVFKLPKFARGLYRQIYPEQGEYRIPSSKYVFVVGHEIPRHKRKEFTAWYNIEHIPGLLSVPGFLTARRFILADREVPPMVEPGGILPRYLTIYDIESEDVFETDAFMKATKTPWTLWVRSWYKRKMCLLYRRIFPQD